MTDNKQACRLENATAAPDKTDARREGGRVNPIMTTRIAGGLLLGCNPKGPRPGTQVPGLNFVQARWPLDAWRARRTGRVTSS